jgi:regulator of cell morphogenesis and NO signaling
MLPVQNATPIIENTARSIIMYTITLDSTVGDIVSADFRTAGIFEEHGIDFCCGGKQSLGLACEKKGLDASAVLGTLIGATDAQAGSSLDFAHWDAAVLAQYIIDTHHRYVARTLPLIHGHAQKVANAHGANHPETIRIAAIFDTVKADLEQHMMKEEQILFPYITRLSLAARNADGAGVPQFGTVRNPIAMMETEHENVGRDLEAIRALSADYTIPADACTTFTTLYRELDAFERDLHVHIHLENNILFPKALALEESLR